MNSIFTFLKSIFSTELAIKRLTDPEIKIPVCTHQNWKVYGSNIIGQGACLLCGQILTGDFLLNDINQRLKRLEGAA